MHIEFLSSGARPDRNEDWAGSLGAPDCEDLVIIDGGTSVAERDYIDPVRGDVVWFVTRYAAALAGCSRAGLGQEDAVHAAAQAAYGEFRAVSAGREIPLHAWPIAAMSWARIHRAADGHRLEWYCLGDCKLLLRTPDGAVRDLDPFVNPQEAILRAEIAGLLAAGIEDPALRQARLLPMLRARRAHQNSVAHTNILCLRPNGRLGARTGACAAPPGSAVLAMTDGFYRLVDTYGLHTPESLFALCLEQGLQAALEQLRGHESAPRDAASMSLKRADDASAILWRAD